MVRLKQILDAARHRLIYVPLMSVVVAIALSQLTLRVDAEMNKGVVPDVLETTVESARSILTALATGLVSSVTLLLSLMLLVVQLASSQFSPRTLRDWLGDTTLQRAIGVVLGTVVYCLLVLRETRNLTDGEALTPNASVIVAVVLGIVSLIAVVWAVDHLTDRLRIGSVASGIMNDTVAMIKRDERLNEGKTGRTDPSQERPEGAMAITAPASGWVQQIDLDSVFDATPEESTMYVASAVGSFVLPSSPLAWVWPVPDEPDHCVERCRAAFAIGDTRTMQTDIGFGILQMVDIAVRALSPGVNDPNTANDIVAHLGVILLALWEREIGPSVVSIDNKTVVCPDLNHADYLHAAFDPIRLYGAHDPHVASAMVRTLGALRGESERRSLPGPVKPIDEVMDQIIHDVKSSDLSDYDKQLVSSLVA